MSDLCGSSGCFAYLQRQNNLKVCVSSKDHWREIYVRESSGRDRNNFLCTGIKV